MRSPSCYFASRMLAKPQAGRREKYALTLTEPSSPNVVHVLPSQTSDCEIAPPVWCKCLDGLASTSLEIVPARIATRKTKTEAHSFIMPAIFKSLIKACSDGKCMAFSCVALFETFPNNATLSTRRSASASDSDSELVKIPLSRVVTGASINGSMLLQLSSRRLRLEAHMATHPIKQQQCAMVRTFYGEKLGCKYASDVPRLAKQAPRLPRIIVPSI